MSGVHLRTLTDADRRRILTWRNAPDVVAHRYADHEISAEEHEHWFASIAGDPRRAYWIIELDGQPVGLANLHDIENAHGRCAWDYYLADPAAHGKSLGGFVEYAILQHVFEHRSLNKLSCEALADNKKALDQHRSFGFVEEARYRQHVLKAGAYRDVIGLSLLAQDWRRIRPDCEARLRARGLPLPRAAI